MDKTIKQIIKENNANGVKDIVWDANKNRWVVYYIGKGLRPDYYYKTFSEVINALKPEGGH